MKALLPFGDTATDPFMLAREVANLHSKDMEITALYVVDLTQIRRVKSYSEAVSPDNIEELLVSAARDEGQKYLDRVRKQLGGKGFTVKTAVRLGEFVDATVKEARESQVDMVMVTSTENVDISRLSKEAPLMVTVLKFGKSAIPFKEIGVTIGLGIASAVWYYFVFTHLDFVNKYLLARKLYSGILVAVFLLVTVGLYGTFIGNILRFVGLDTKSAH
jgi:nucleotide-binding universal stress UspA family protein